MTVMHELTGIILQILPAAAHRRRCDLYRFRDVHKADAMFRDVCSRLFDALHSRVHWWTSTYLSRLRQGPQRRSGRMSQNWHIALLEPCHEMLWSRLPQQSQKPKDVYITVHADDVIP